MVRFLNVMSITYMFKSYKPGRMVVSIILIALVIGGLIYFSNSRSNINQHSEASLSVPQKQFPNGPVINFWEASSHIGEYVVIHGLVNHVFVSNQGTIFFNFCPNYKTCPFSSVIFNSDAHKFLDVRAYENKAVEISGTITIYQGRAQIIIKNNSQIKLK